MKKPKRTLKIPRVPVQLNQTGAGAHKDKKKEANKTACRRNKANDGTAY